MAATLPPPPSKQRPTPGWVWASLGLAVVLAGTYALVASRRVA